MILQKYRISYFFLISIISSSYSLSFGQYESLQNDASIPWIAEFRTDYNFSLSTSPNQEMLNLIKFSTPPSSFEGHNQSNWIINWVYQNALNGNYECFKDPGLIQSLSQKDIENLTSTTDTVVVFHADTYEEQVHIVKNELSVNNLIGLRTNQIIYYNSNTGVFHTRLLSVAPLFQGQENTVSLTRKKGSDPIPLFWIKMNETISKDFNPQTSNITWGALAYSKAHPLTMNFIEVVKNENQFNFKAHINKTAKEIKRPIEADEYGSNYFLNNTEIDNISSSIDTIITFDPATFEESIMIVKNEINLNDISQYRLVQEWYYDENKKCLMNRLKAIAPIINVKDENGKYKYSKAIYYIRYD